MIRADGLLDVASAGKREMRPRIIGPGAVPAASATGCRQSHRLSENRVRRARTRTRAVAHQRLRDRGAAGDVDGDPHSVVRRGRGVRGVDTSESEERSAIGENCEHRRQAGDVVRPTGRSIRHHHVVGGGIGGRHVREVQRGEIDAVVHRGIARRAGNVRPVPAPLERDRRGVNRRHGVEGNVGSSGRGPALRMHANVGAVSLRRERVVVVDQGCDDVGVNRVGDEVVGLVGIEDDVEEGIAERVAGQLIADQFEHREIRAVAEDIENAAARAAAGDKRSASIVRRVEWPVARVDQQRPHIRAIKGLCVKRCHARRGAERREPITGPHELLTVCHARPAHRRRRVDAAVEQITLVAAQRKVRSARSCLAAVVAEIDHQRVGRDALGINRVQHPAHRHVHLINRREGDLSVSGGVGVFVEVVRRRAHRAVDRVEREVNDRRLRGITLLKKLNRLVGEQISGPALVEVSLAIEPPVERAKLSANVIRVTDRAGVFAIVNIPTPILRLIVHVLADDWIGDAIDDRVCVGVVKPAEVPLATHERLVARRLERLGHDVLAQIKAVGVAYRRPVGTPPRQQGRSRHAAHRRRVKSFEPNAVTAEAIHVRRRGNAAMRADITPTLIVRHDDEHVRLQRPKNTVKLFVVVIQFTTPLLELIVAPTGAVSRLYVSDCAGRSASVAALVTEIVAPPLIT